MRRLWESWRGFATEMGNYQSRLLLVLFYFLVVMPFGTVVRLYNDPLRLRRASGSTFWVERRPGSDGLDRAREQF